MSFSSQAEAVRTAREVVWGTVPFARRTWHGPSGEYSVNDAGGFPQIVFTAQVNKDLVVIQFDQYGRLQGKVQVLPR